MISATPLKRPLNIGAKQRHNSAEVSQTRRDATQKGTSWVWELNGRSGRERLQDASGICTDSGMVGNPTPEQYGPESAFRVVVNSFLPCLELI